MFKDFKEFALKGNIVSMAIGVIIGGAFGKIVTSLVNDIIMPVIGILLGGIDLSGYQWEMKQVFAEGEGVALRYGAFIQAIIDFLIIALSIFLFLRLFDKLLKKANKEEKEEKSAKSEEVLLLKEIRDILQEKNE